MYKLIVSELAREDLDNIVSYIAIQLANLTAAGDFLDEVAKYYDYLKSNPVMYAKCQDMRLEKEGYRKACCKIPIPNFGKYWMSSFKNTSA